jgi:hypothetical protein
MLSDFENQSVFSAWDFEGIKNRRSTFIELDIDDGTNDGNNSALKVTSFLGGRSNALTGD